jgi:succinylglutamate desuccinylase
MIFDDLELHPDRIIGHYIGQEEGPLLILVGGLHGNETAGIEAIKLIETMLYREEEVNLGFKYHGKMLGIRGNIHALFNHKRQVDIDLNRIWHKIPPHSEPMSEFTDKIEIQSVIEAASIDHNPLYPVYLMDIHTTSSHRGIFAVPTQDNMSQYITGGLHCPVITNLTTLIKGSMVQYYADRNVGGRQITSFAFEAGQHDDPGSISRAVGAIVNCMRSIKSVASYDVESRHDEVLQAYSAGLPRYCELFYIHHIKDASLWEMNPGYLGFQSVQKGQQLAFYDNHPIFCPDDGLIVMPLYQSIGQEGFFLVRALE